MTKKQNTKVSIDRVCKTCALYDPASGYCWKKNEAWPTKATIQAISEALGVPISCLLFASITDEDVPEKNRAIFNALKQPILDLF